MEGWSIEVTLPSGDSVPEVLMEVVFLIFFLTDVDRKSTNLMSRVGKFPERPDRKMHLCVVLFTFLRAYIYG